MRLHINIDHIATLRNQRDAGYPDPLQAVYLCHRAGADGITVHLREDRRHIRDTDVERICGARLLPVNLEMAATPQMIEIARRVRPQVVTLVPEKREEKTTEGGLDVVSEQTRIGEVARMCKEQGIRLSLFIEADSAQVHASQKLGAQQVEFHTGHYCEGASDARPRLLEQIVTASRLAQGLGLEVAAGHGLNCNNVGSIAQVREIEELNIGHSIISDSVFCGLVQAITNMREAIVLARSQL